MDDAPGLIRSMRWNAEESRYEAELEDGSMAVVDVRERDDQLLVTYTGTPPRHRRKGVAACLTRFALDHAIARGLEIVPVCPYTEWFIRQNPEYAGHDSGQDPSS